MTAAPDLPDMHECELVGRLMLISALPALDPYLHCYPRGEARRETLLKSLVLVEYCGTREMAETIADADGSARLGVVWDAMKKDERAWCIQLLRWKRKYHDWAHYDKVSPEYREQFRRALRYALDVIATADKHLAGRAAA